MDGAAMSKTYNWGMNQMRLDAHGKGTERMTLKDAVQRLQASVDEVQRLEKIIDDYRNAAHALLGYAAEDHRHYDCPHCQDYD